MIAYTYLPTKEILNYPLKYAAILHLPELDQDQLASSAKHGYQALLQLNLVYMYFYSR